MWSPRGNMLVGTRNSWSPLGESVSLGGGLAFVNEVRCSNEMGEN